ncbi:MAG: hypothetical protein LBF97_03350 [Elusimicrobiota bacterium]|jgi:hypothetical protein|nr:hypothetical protein [Elusimicrobiota bacterium]
MWPKIKLTNDTRLTKIDRIIFRSIYHTLLTGEGITWNVFFKPNITMNDYFIAEKHLMELGYIKETGHDGVCLCDNPHTECLRK